MPNWESMWKNRESFDGRSENVSKLFDVFGASKSRAWNWINCIFVGLFSLIFIGVGYESRIGGESLISRRWMVRDFSVVNADSNGWSIAWKINS